MSKAIIHCAFIIALSSVFVSTYKIRLERVVIEYFDPNYVRDPSTRTGRLKRGESYKTNVTVTTLTEWKSNISAIIYYKRGHSNVDQEMLRAKICDLLNVAWFVAMMKKYSDVPTVCPFPPNTYHLRNLELSPKAFPLPLPEGDNYIGIKYVHTKGSKRILTLQGTVHVE